MSAFGEIESPLGEGLDRPGWSCCDIRHSYARFLRTTSARHCNSNQMSRASRTSGRRRSKTIGRRAVGFMVGGYW